MKEKYKVIIVGAGPAGLTAGYELIKLGIRPIIIEQADRVGGISRTETYKGYRFDIGGHRFYTKIGEVQQFWLEILDQDLLKVSRLSRIYYKGKFFNYPIEIVNTLSNLGLVNSALVILSYLQSQIRPYPAEENLEQWVSNRFGKRLYQTFFKSYTEKVWGISCQDISADWAAQRIQDMSLKKAITNAIYNNNKTKSLIKEFYYPVLGPGMMWEKTSQIICDSGGEVHTETKVLNIHHKNCHIQGITLEENNKQLYIETEYLISSMPIGSLITRMDPLPDKEILEAAKSLKYRDFLIVALIIEESNLFKDQWIYIHESNFKVGRIQNFKNWSSEMVPDSKQTCLGMEYFCSVGDNLWSMSDENLIQLASTEIVELGLLSNIKKIIDATVIRQLKAYPVYDDKYQEYLKLIKEYLQKFDNLQSIGRNGLHRYNNQDHSMLTGILAARNIAGENNDLWNVNTERSYYEEFIKK
jgi:protoporphyrinogen oxidase